MLFQATSHSDGSFHARPLLNHGIAHDESPPDHANNRSKRSANSAYNSPHIIHESEKDGHLAAGMTHPRNDKSPLKAYDCTRPTHIYPTTYAASGPCSETRKVREMKNQTYQLLFMEQKEKALGSVCKILDTRTVVACNAHDYMTLRPEHGYDSLPRLVGVEECQDMVRTGVYKDPNGHKHSISKNGVSSVNYLEAGKTWTNEGWDKGESECSGEDWTNDGDTMADMVVSHHLHITVLQAFVMRKESEVYAYESALRLPCSWEVEACRTEEGTYLWKREHNFCPLAESRTTGGYTTKTNKGEEVYISNDGSLVRAVITGTTILCDRIVHMTNYAGLYLYETNKPRQFTRHIDPSEGRLSIYVKNRDDFLFHHVLEKVEQEMNAFLENNCRNQESNNRVDFFLRRMQPGLVTFALGNGTFASGAGDTLYRYVCQPILVVAQDSAHCHEALPVRPYRGETGVNTSSPLLYMEPLTHRITKHAVPVPCSKHFIGTYQAANGIWIAANPTVHVTSAPIQVESTTADFEFKFEMDTDWSTGGVFDDEDLKKIEDYLEYPKLRDAIDFDRAAAYLGITRSNQYALEKMYPHAPPVAWISQELARFQEWVDTVGRTASIIVVVYMGCSFIKSLADFLCRCGFQAKQGGFNRLLCLTCCPSYFLERDVTRQWVAKVTSTTEKEINEEQLRRSRGPSLAGSRAASPERPERSERRDRRDDDEGDDSGPRRSRDHRRSRRRSESSDDREYLADRGRSRSRYREGPLRSARRRLSRSASRGRDFIEMHTRRARSRSRSIIRDVAAATRRGYERARSSSRTRAREFNDRVTQRMQQVFRGHPQSSAGGQETQVKFHHLSQASAPKLESAEGNRDVFQAQLLARPATPGFPLHVNASTTCTPGDTTPERTRLYPQPTLYGSSPPSYHTVTPTTIEHQVDKLRLMYESTQQNIADAVARPDRPAPGAVRVAQPVLPAPVLSTRPTTASLATATTAPLLSTFATTTASNAFAAAAATLPSPPKSSVNQDDIFSQVLESSPSD